MINNIIKIFVGIFLMLGISCTPKKKETNQERDDKHNTMLTLTGKDRLLANIQSDTARRKNISEVTTLVGTTAIDEQKVDVLTSRVKGRLDELYVKHPGEFVYQGELVYAIYSEELLADENDYLNTLDQYNNAKAQKEIAKQLLDAARKKLSLWTLTETQINELEKKRSVSSLITFYSNYSGYVIELTIREGEYVAIGQPVLKLANLSSLWIETQVYSDEVSYLKQNPSLSIEFEAFPNELYKGEIVFDNPALEENQKVNLIRVKIDNKANKIKPGMMAYLYLKRNEKHTLVIPKSALLLESTTSVWVEDKDGMFEQRMVTTGIQNKKEVEILSGIQPGEKVVVSGAYFLKSENVIRQSGGTMGGMKM